MNGDVVIQLECSHAWCGETCDFKPPTIGPRLPRQVRDVTGELWTRHSSVEESTIFYWQRGKDVRIVFWKDILGGTPLYRERVFPEGPWTVVLDGDWNLIDELESHR